MGAAWAGEPLEQVKHSQRHENFAAAAQKYSEVLRVLRCPWHCSLQADRSTSGWGSAEPGPRMRGELWALWWAPGRGDKRLGDALKGVQLVRRLLPRPKGRFQRWELLHVSAPITVKTMSCL